MTFRDCQIIKKRQICSTLIKWIKSYLVLQEIIKKFLPLCIEFLLNVIINDAFNDRNIKDQTILINTLSSSFYLFEVEDSDFNSVINKFINLFSSSDNTKGETFKNVSEQIICNLRFLSNE